MTSYEFLDSEIMRLYKNPTDECIEWPYSRKPSGYGQLGHNGKLLYAHRLAFELFHGYMPITDVRHLCRNKSCYNPEHLYTGTPTEMRTIQLKHQFNDAEMSTARLMLASGIPSSRVCNAFDVSRDRLRDWLGTTRSHKWGILTYPQMSTRHYNPYNRSSITGDYAKECSIVDLYNSGMTCYAIGDLFDVTHQRISQILQRVYQEANPLG